MLTNISNFPFLFQNSIDKNPIFSPPIKKKIQPLFIYLIFLGNNVIQEEDEPVIISRNDIAVEQDISSNGINHHHTNGNGVRYPKENNDVDHHNNILNNDKNADQQSNGKTSQSYLALTKLGMGGGGGTNKNGGGSSPKETKKSDSPMPNSKNGIKEGITTKRKGMAEMAASTLKGFTKM